MIYRKRSKSELFEICFSATIESVNMPNRGKRLRRTIKKLLTLNMEKCDSRLSSSRRPMTWVSGLVSSVIHCT